MMLIQVRHNIEVAHRLSLLEGKCENIHGHSMWIELSLLGEYVNDKGILHNKYDEPFEFGAIKKRFRSHLDTVYDHRLLLNESDPWAGKLKTLDGSFHKDDEAMQLPGLVTCEGDPSTENIAFWIARWAAGAFKCDANVKVEETAVNAAVMGVGYVHDA